MQPHLRLAGFAAVAVLGGGGFAGCSKSVPVATPSAAFDERSVPTPTDPVLALGQRVYRGDCYNCHDLGKKGAPRVADGTAWAPRVAQGIDTLVRHAIKGFAGPAGNEMPARGGNDALSDAEVSAAVHYLVSHVK